MTDYSFSVHPSRIPCQSITAPQEFEMGTERPKKAMALMGVVPRRGSNDKIRSRTID